MANATTIVQKTLRIGVDEPLYVASGGAVNTTGTVGTAPNGTFGIPPQSAVWRGQLILQAINRGGTVTAFTANLEISLDGGNTWAALATAITFGGLPAAQRVDVSGCGGNGTLRLNFTTVTLGTGTGADVYAHIG
jgi:hypothetical protein